MVNDKIRTCARAAYEAIRSYRMAIGEKPEDPWESMRADQQESYIRGVRSCLFGNTPEEQRAHWLKEKFDTGWQYGPAKDPVAKLHPCMVPYADLPKEQRMKDMLFTGTVRLMAATLGMKVTYPSPDHDGTKRTVDWSATTIVF